MEINNSVAAWSAGLAAQRLPRWDELPDIDLYLDQVLTLLDKYLGPFLPENGGHALTASMINNYVKLRIVPAPVKKRYGRVQLAYLLVIGLLKQVLPIPDVKTLLESQFEGAQEQTDGGAEKRGFAKAFDCFCTLQETAFADMARQAAQLETAAGTRRAGYGNGRAGQRQQNAGGKADCAGHADVKFFGIVKQSPFCSSPFRLRKGVPPCCFYSAKC